MLCTKGSRIKYVEVKGTRTDERTVRLTAGEVAFIVRNEPHCALCVAHRIRITGDSKPIASGTDQLG